MDDYSIAQLVRMAKYYLDTMEAMAAKLTGFWMTGSEQGTTSPIAFMEALEILGELQASVRTRYPELEEFVAAPTPDKATMLLASIEKAREEGKAHMTRLEKLGYPI